MPFEPRALGARLVIAGTHSGAGKTTVATGLLAALRRAGHRPAGAKVGPDFIDPGYHALASGSPPRNLDPWLCGPDAIVPLAARAGGDPLVVEGVMGLFDGAADGTTSSTADVARLLDAPVVLVVDCAALSGSVAAIVHGYSTWVPPEPHSPEPSEPPGAPQKAAPLRLGGVILNRVGSETHEAMLREAVAATGVPVLGALPRDPALTWRDRHLGLIPVVERPAELETSLRRLADVVAAGVDLEAVMALARSAPTIPAPTPRTPAPARQTPAPERRRARVAVAGGKAFSFTYTDTLEALASAGAEVVTIDPLADEALPEGTDGLLIGGGFPEAYLDALSANRPWLDDVASAVRAGLPTWAECAGMLLLSADLDGRAMAGVLNTRARMTEHLALGYRRVRTRRPSWLGPAGREFRGHEFHYSATDPAGDALALDSRWGQRLEGFGSASLLATYVHHHPGGDPSLVEAFVAAAAAVARTRRTIPYELPYPGERP